MHEEENLRTLLPYCSQEIVSEKYKKIHGGSCNSQQARSITSSFLQAREYCKSYTSSEDSIKPLLLYYYVSSLIGGFNQIYGRVWPNQASPSHGLKTINWKANLLSANPNPMDLDVKVLAAGLFPSFLATTRNSSFLRSGFSRAMFYQELPDVRSGKTFSFSEIVTRIPSTRKALRHVGLFPNTCKFEVTEAFGELPVATQVNWPTTAFNAHKTDDFLQFVEEVIVRDKGKILNQDDNEVKINFPNNLEILPVLTDNEYSFIGSGIGDTLAVREYTNFCGLSTTATLFSASYFLGMIARYFPSYWVGVVRGQRNDSTMPLFKDIMDIVFSEFLKRCFQFLSPPPNLVELKPPSAAPPSPA